ncbi:MAG: GNAT family N-acetyltransferase [Acidiferrobacterales bacterium]|nr:GNAT family N-acetyltransferase [Acidiferrobacterales bacterium]
MVTYEWSDWRDGVQWWLQSVYVRSDFRRKGIFRKLWNFTAKLASEDSNVCGIRLYVEKDNKPAQETYRSIGMEATNYLVYETTLRKT